MEGAVATMMRSATYFPLSDSFPQTLLPLCVSCFRHHPTPPSAQSPATVGKPEKRKRLKYAVLQAPANAFSALITTRDEQVSGSSPLVGSRVIGLSKPITRNRGSLDCAKVGFLTPLAYASDGADPPLKSGLSALYKYERKGQKNRCQSHLRLGLCVDRRGVLREPG